MVWQPITRPWVVGFSMDSHQTGQAGEPYSTATNRAVSASR